MTGSASISVRNPTVFPGLPVSSVAMNPFPALVPFFGTFSIKSPKLAAFSLKISTFQFPLSQPQDFHVNNGVLFAPLFHNLGLISVFYRSSNRLHIICLLSKWLYFIRLLRHIDI